MGWWSSAGQRIRSLHVAPILAEVREVKPPRGRTGSGRWSLSLSFIFALIVGGQLLTPTPISTCLACTWLTILAMACVPRRVSHARTSLRFGQALSNHPRGRATCRWSLAIHQKKATLTENYSSMISLSLSKLARPWRMKKSMPHWKTSLHRLEDFISFLMCF